MVGKFDSDVALLRGNSESRAVGTLDSTMLRTIKTLTRLRLCPARAIRLSRKGTRRRIVWKRQLLCVFYFCGCGLVVSVRVGVECSLLLIAKGGLNLLEVWEERVGNAVVDRRGG